MSARVHVVDDEPKIRQLIQDALEVGGYDVEVFDGGATYLEASPEPPDVLLLDLLMPEIDGREVASRVQKTYEDPPPIVAVTAIFGSKIASVEDLGPDFDDILGKPFGLDELTDVVEGQLGSPT